MIEDKLYTTEEMREKGIYTDDFLRMGSSCEVTGTLYLKACGDRKTMRMFFLLDDGRKIFTPVFWWQRYLNLPGTPIGTRFRLTYVSNNKAFTWAKPKCWRTARHSLNKQRIGLCCTSKHRLLGPKGSQHTCQGYP